MLPPPSCGPFSPSTIPGLRDWLRRCRFLTGAAGRALAVTPKGFPGGAGLRRGAQGRGSVSFVITLLGGKRGKLELREELWSFSCWAGFHFNKAEPCVPRSALVLLTGERGEPGRGWRRRRDQPRDVPGPSLLLAYKARGHAGCESHRRGRGCRCPTSPATGMSALRWWHSVSPAQSWRWGRCLSSPPLCTHLLSKEQENPTVQLRSGFGAFFLSTLPILGPVVPFWGWFAPGALATPLRAAVLAVQHPPWSGVSDTRMLLGAGSIPKKKPCQEPAISFRESLSAPLSPLGLSDRPSERDQAWSRRLLLEEPLFSSPWSCFSASLGGNCLIPAG